MSPPADEADRAPAQTPAPACRNCGVAAPDHFCPNCGQETRIALPTFAAFMRDAAGRYVALDGRMWRTLFALVARPGFLTQEYFAGRRRRYIRPARLFLVLWLLLFAVVGLLQSPADLGEELVFVDRAEDAATRAGDGGAKASGAPAEQGAAPLGAAAGNALESVPGGGDGGKDTRIALDEDLNLILRLDGADLPIPEQLRKRYDQFKKLPRDAKAERLYAGMLRYGPYAAAALLPAFALLLKLAYLGRRGRYPGRPHRYSEHLVYSAHVHAFAAVALLALVLAPFELVRVALFAWIVYYLIRARQVVYRGRWWANLLRTFVIAIAYLTLLGFAIAGLVAVAVLLR
ncbi:MAG: DUF3667 domain-containing protein [Betaproteobacteria bacterium]|nr:DUF3667 domain-containing protein [Betaproteobacteria bacterium]